MLLGQKIKKAVETSGLTPEQVAAHAEMSTTNLYKIYKRDSIDSKYLKKISEALGKTYNYFLDDESDEQIDYNVNNRGFGNAGRDIGKQKIMPGGIYTEHSQTTGNIENIEYKLQICEAEKKSLLSQLELKDQLLATKDELISHKNELINQLKK